jgi:MFS superfamily sulfate permease-like transporter
LSTLALIAIVSSRAHRPASAGAIVAVLAAIAVSVAFGLEDQGIAMVGEIPVGLLPFSVCLR